MKTGNILWPENTLSDNVDFINRKIMCSYWLLGPQVQYILCNMRTATSVNYIKEDVEQDFLEKPFDTFGGLICVPQEQFPSLSFKNKAV